MASSRSNDPRSDKNSKQAAVKAYLETTTKELDIPEASQFSSAYAVKPEFITTDSYSDELSSPENMKDVQFNNMRGVLNGIAHRLGDFAATDEDRLFLNTNHPEAYREHLHNSALLNEGSIYPPGALENHLAFMNALDNFVESGQMVPPKLFKDEIGILQVILKDQKADSAEVLNTQSAEDAEREAISTKAALILHNFKKNELDKIPDYVNDEMKARIKALVDREIEIEADGGFGLLSEHEQDKFLYMKNTLKADLRELVADNITIQASDYEHNFKSSRDVAAYTSSEADVALKLVQKTQQLAKDLGIDMRTMGRGVNE